MIKTFCQKPKRKYERKPKTEPTTFEVGGRLIADAMRRKTDIEIRKGE